MAPDGLDACAHLASHYRVVGMTDADVSTAMVRRSLEDHRVAEYFETVGSSAGFGPQVNSRIVRRVTSHHRHSQQVVFVTAREQLVKQFTRSRMGVVLTAPDEFGGVPEAVASLVSGRVSP